MFITSHPLCGPAATAAVRRSPALDQSRAIYLRIATPGDAEFVAALRSRPDIAIERRLLQHAAFLTEEGEELSFIAVANGRDRGLVRLHDFTEIAGESSFAWSHHLSEPLHPPGLATTIARLVYDVGLGTIGFARAHLIVPATDAALAAFHVGLGAEVEHDDGNHLYLRFGADDHVLGASAARVARTNRSAA